MIEERASTKMWWEQPWVPFAFALLATTPLWFTKTPPLIDFIGHIARYSVQLNIDRSEYLQRYYDYNWALVGNLGVDLLIMPLSAMLGLERAAWVVAALLPALMILGMFRAVKAVHGYVPATALAAIPFALAYPYQYGFVNFWLASGLAFHAFATWVQLRDRWRLRATIFVPVGLIVWVCHVYGWGILCLLVGGHELARTTRLKGWTATACLRAFGASTPLLAPLLLMGLWREEGEGSVTLGWFWLKYKFMAFSYTLRDQSKLLDLFSLIAAACLLYAGLRDKRLAFDGRFGIAALLFAAALIFLPYQLFGSAFADMRVAPFLFIAGLLALRPTGEGPQSGRLSQIVAAFATGVFLVRIAASAIGYAQYDAAYDRHLQALRYVPVGARVAIFNGIPCAKSWRHTRLDHLGSMMLLRREAFVNSQWDVPGAQLLRPKGALGTYFNADPSHLVASRTCVPDLRPELARRLAAFPRDRFDFVWILDFDPARLSNLHGLQRLHADDRTSLYRITDSARTGD